ncbi:MAG: hypothetical protein MJZ41_04255 [Bacteroidaceae bacterium]|nr:hypothetical protein [Bacteroidaceae bacterium]
MMKNSIKIVSFFSLLSCLFIISSCNSNNSDSSVIAEEDADDYEYITDLISDSVEGDKVSKECAVICYRVEQVSDRVNTVHSPQQLMELKKEYSKKIGEATKGTEELDKSEKQLVAKHAEEVEESYRNACSEFEVPAVGVIQNLSSLIKRIDQIKTKDEFYRFQDCRYGMLQDLDYIHLCVEHNDKRINEVKRLAQVLKSKYESKKHELGVN